MNRNEKEGTQELVDPTYFNGLRYLTSTRPDIAYEVGIIPWFMEKPYQSHLQATKQILNYVSGTYNHGISYSYSSNFSLVGYTNND